MLVAARLRVVQSAVAEEALLQSLQQRPPSGATDTGWLGTLAEGGDESPAANTLNQLAVRSPCCSFLDGFRWVGRGSKAGLLLSLTVRLTLLTRTVR